MPALNKLSSNTIIKKFSLNDIKEKKTTLYQLKIEQPTCSTNSHGRVGTLEILLQPPTRIEVDSSMVSERSVRSSLRVRLEDGVDDTTYGAICRDLIIGWGQL